MNSILALAILLTDMDKTKTVIELGELLVESDADALADGGFWIWELDSNVEFYSPRFREVLGYEDENDFPNLASSWQDAIHLDSLKLAVFNYEMAIKTNNKHPYYQEVTYNKKDKSTISFLCSGIVIKHKGINRYLVGTHKILKDDNESISY